MKPTKTTGKLHLRTKQVAKSGDHSPEQCNHKLNGQYIHYKPVKALEGKPLVQLYDNQGTRSLIVPNPNPTDIPGILPLKEFRRLQNQAHVVTIQDRMEMVRQSEKERLELQAQSNARKEKLAMMQKTQMATPGSKLESVEKDAKEKNLYLLRRSYEMVQEQDERVKQANRLILATKCHAIRNAQISEKELIRREREKEEKRLDLMMEQVRKREEEKEKHTHEQNKLKKQKYITDIQQQLKENETERVIEAERIEEESRMLNKAIIEIQKEDAEKIQKKREAQLLLRESFNEAHKEARLFRELKQEEERVTELRIKQFMKQKQEREEAQEKEKQLVKLAKAKEIARLHSDAEKALNNSAILDEMNALRNLEEKEREWREKEKRDAIRRKEMAEELKIGRIQQIEDLRRSQAIALARDEQDFYKVANVQKKLFEQELQKKAQKKKEKEEHQRELLKQINEKERERIQQMQEKFDSGKASRLEYEVKDRQIEDYLKTKVQKLRESAFPENYVKEIERQLNLTK